MEDLTIITTCVGYSDFLELTLPHMMCHGRVIVATSPTDVDTCAVAMNHVGDTGCFITDAWHKDGAPFNKGAGINAAIEFAQPKTWLLLLDADIILPPLPVQAKPETQLNPLHFYSVRRRDCPTADCWRRCLRDGKWFQLPMMPLPPVKRRGKKFMVWGVRPTANPIGLQGYFQLWNYELMPRKMHEHRTATKYDVDLALNWPDDRRMLLPWQGYCVIHLGTPRVNWKGRQTERWNVDPVSRISLASSAHLHYRYG